MKIRKDPQKAKSACTAGTFGWSGAFGTHFFVSPKDHLSAVWMMNRSDIDGAGSYISKKSRSLCSAALRNRTAKGSQTANKT